MATNHESSNALLLYSTSECDLLAKEEVKLAKKSLRHSEDVSFFWLAQQGRTLVINGLEYHASEVQYVLYIVPLN